MKRNILIFIQLLFVLTLGAQTQIKITSTNLNLRSTPSTSGSVITVIPKGTKVEIDANCDCKWIAVNYDNKIGYVNSGYLESPPKHVANYSGNATIKYYTNSFGEKVQSPTYYNSVPAGATALCRDGTYSFSRNRRGTCSHHGGVAKWL
jgi:uncharacterized protein YraI